MNEVISSVAQTAFQQNPEGQTSVTTQDKQPSKKFDDVLKLQTEQSTQNQSVSPSQNENMSPADKAKIEELEAELRLKNQQIQSTPEVNDMLKGMLRFESTGDLLKAAVSGGKMNLVDGQSNILSMLKSTQTEWQGIEKIFMSGKNLSQSELLLLQAKLYQVSHHVDVMSKVIDQMTGGVKTILNTNI
ncbi:MAG: hypothetical protein MUC29_01185 [Pyrinomonadaceae bacterium]|jgi:hypothetical protein|nr:hypothetical protein [Pyrinomonadaceae bacterium]